MGQVLKREHGSKRTAFAALLTTGMLAALIALTGLAAPLPAYAADLQGSGTEDDPTLIYNTGDLIAWCNKLNDMGVDAERQQHARLMDHLTAPGPDGTEYGGAVTNDVIAAMNHPDLQVTEFDGNGYLVELQLDGDYGALFKTGGLPDGDIDMKMKDFHFIGSVRHAQVDRGDCAGTLFETVGTDYDRQLTILDCTNQASVFGDQATGGFIGSFVDKAHGAITIKRCSSFGEIMSAEGHAGGIAGSIEQYGDAARDGAVTYCTNNGLIKSMGGSFKTNTYPNSLNPDKDKPETIGGSAGGLVGYLAFEDKVRFSLGHDYNQGEIYSFSGLGYSGGLVGFVDTPRTIAHYVVACYNSGPIQPLAKTSERVGGLFGYSTYGTVPISNSLTAIRSVPPDAVSDTTRNGTIAHSSELGSTHGLAYLDYDAYIFGYSDMYIDDGYPALEGVGVARDVKVTLISPMTNKYSYDYTYWNTVFSHETAYTPEGYRLAYWTREAPDEGSTWSTPPKEFKSDPDDIHARIYGGEPVLYAYCVPSSATVKFDLNKPAAGYICSRDPEQGNKTIVKGEPVGALPTATCVNPNDKKDTRAFLGWATMSDGNDPKAEWISENSDNLYDFVNGNHEVTLYAQWANAGRPFEITRQPENCTVPAVAEGVSHEASFDFYTTYSTSPSYGYWAKLQYRSGEGASYKDVENLLLSAAPNQFFFNLESSKEAKGDYRIKIEYYENGNTMGTLYTSSANIVLDIPQSEVQVSSVALKEDNESDEVLGTHSYDVHGSILGDLPSLMDESVPGNFAHRAWIEGGPDNILPDDSNSAQKLYIDNVRSFTLESQHLKEGQTYTLCVSRVLDNYFQHGRYRGESEPYRVSFTVPYADSVAASITPVKVTEQPVVQDGKAVDFKTDYQVSVNAPFNLVSDVQYASPQPDNREVAAQWQYSLGHGWVDVPDEYFVKDGNGNPVVGMAWNDDRTSARVYASLNANATLNQAVFRVRLTTPPTPTDTISDQSTKKLSLSVPAPEITDLKVINDTHVSLTWKWQDGAGNTLPAGGYYVDIERKDDDTGHWILVDCGHVYTYTYDAALNPQGEYRASVRADMGGMQGPSAESETFKTAGSMSLKWEDSYCQLWLDPSYTSHLDVDYNWEANYNDGKHVALYEWRLSKEMDSPALDTFATFKTTETDGTDFPEGFEGPWDPEEAQWVQVVASVWTLDANGDPETRLEETVTNSAAIPVVSDSEGVENPSVKNVGSHSATVCWEAPKPEDVKGTIREYQVKLKSHVKVIPAVPGQQDYEVTFDNLDSDTDHNVYIYTSDSRKSNSTCTTTLLTDRCKTLPHPEAGTWTVAASSASIGQGDELTLTASYEANSGSFSNVVLQWYSWREGDSTWVAEGDPIALEDGSQAHTETLTHTVMPADYGRQWKLGVKATTPDESDTGSSDVVTVTVEPPAPSDVACNDTTQTGTSVSWAKIEGVDGYLVKSVKLNADGNPVSVTTSSVDASSLTSDDTGKLHYGLTNLDANTTYQVSVAAFAYGASGGFSSAASVKTLPTPTIDAPVFVQVPKSVQVEAGKDATFTAQAGVGDGGAISYAWQHKGVSEQEFTAVEPGEKYAIDTDAATGVTTLTVKGVGAEQVGAFRCVATNSKDGETVNAVGTAAYLSVTPVKATNPKSWATGPTTGEVTWTAEGAVRRFQVRWRQIGEFAAIGPEYSKIVTLADGETQGGCQLDGLTPNSIYSILIDPAPQVGFWGSGLQVQTSFTTPPASALETATVTMSPDRTVEPGTPVTFSVATNVDDDASEAKEYCWQRNTFGEGWYDVDGAKAATLTVAAPEGGTVEGYRCVVTSTKDSSVNVKDKKTVTSDAKLLATNVPVAQPVQLAAEPGTTSVHLSWASDDVRPATYEVQYAEGPTPGDNAWTTVENVGAGTSCDVEGLAPNTVYSWRVKALVRDRLLQSDWAQADTFITLEEPSALATVSVTPRFGATVAGSGKDVTYTATTNLDNALNGETLSYQWQQSATGDEWSDVRDATGATFVADASDKAPRSCLYRCAVTASKDGETLKTVTSEAAGFTATPQIPTALKADSITAATANLSWTGSLDGAPLTYRVFWRASGTAEWSSTPDLTEATYVLNSLMPATTYEWYVQVMNDGNPSVRSATSLFVTQSLSPVPALTRVVVGPADQTPGAAEKAKLAAYTNVDDMASAGATLAYKWEKRDPDSESWTELAGKTTREIELDANTAGYVRCTVTYTRPVGTFAPLNNTAVTSNEARVRVMPAAPANLGSSDVGQTSAKLAWTGDATASGIAYDVTYSVVGSGEWQHVRTAGVEVTLDDLTPNTAYEWRVRAVAYGASGDPLASDWVIGSPFATSPEEVKLSRVEVKPSATSVMAGAEGTVTLTATPDVTDNDETLAYQWQRFTGDQWQKMDGETKNTLEVSVKTLSVGQHAYRCVVEATRTGGVMKQVESNESTVTAMPAAPTDLSVSDIQLVDPDNHLSQVKATFHWKWGDTSLPDDTTFEVSYRKLAGKGSMLEGWISKGLTIDNESRTCQASALDATDITYQWRVRVVQNGAVSPWSEVNTFTTAIETPENLNLVEVTPSDSLVSNDESATVTLTASTNVDGKVDESTLTYGWEWCELATPNPRSNEYENAWKPIDGATSKEITLSGDERNRYVRCKVTQTIDGVAGNPVASNPACVRTEPLSPSNLRASMSATSPDAIDLKWDCDDSRANSAREKVIGFEVDYRKVGTSEWTQAVPANATDIVFFSKSCTLKSTSLEPDATYEWRVRTVLNNDLAKSWVKGGPHTEWVDGSTFVAPRVDVTPARAAAVIGNGRTLTFTVSANDAATNGGSETYQWERKEGTKWVPVQGATGKTLSIVANDATAAGTSRYHCLVKVNNNHTTSNEVTCTLAPAAPTGLAASDVTSSEATVAWAWEKGGLQNADEFKVLYRETSAREWTTATAAGDARKLVLEGLKPETAYEWHVQAVQNGVGSLPSFASLFVTASEHPDLKLESVLIEPADQAVAPGAQATVTATTNLDGMVDADKLTYVWQKRALDSDNKEENWQTIDGETGSSVTLPVKTSGYVRCKVTYAADGSAAADPVTSNEASVRVQPGSVPTSLEVKDIGDTTASFTWAGALSDGGSFTLSYRAVGTDAWTVATGLKASPYTATDLAPNTTYEWRMCTVSADGVASVWVDGSTFTTTAQDGVLGSVVVAPERVDAVAGDSALVDDFFATVSGTTEDQSLAYQWQVQLAGGWTNLPGQTGERTHLSVANLEAGEHSLRCVVTATAAGGKSKTVESNEVTLALSPAMPSDLDVREATRDAATLAWTWAGPGTVDSFNVRYREEGATDLDWVAVPAEKIDAAIMTCFVEGLAPGMSYEWQVQAEQGGQASEWAASGFVTRSTGSLKIVRIWPPDVALATGEQASFKAFTNRGDADDVSYAWQRRALDSEDVEASWVTIPGATGRELTLDANTTGYVRCVATQTASAAGAAEVAEVAETPEMGETNEMPETGEVTEVAETGEVAEVAETAEMLAVPEPAVAISNQARVREIPDVPSGLAVGEVGFGNATLSWAASGMPDSTYTLAYHAVGTSEWTEVAGLTTSAYALEGLVSGTSFEWRVQTVAGAGGDPLASEWAYGDPFTTQALKTYQVIAGADGTWKSGQPGLPFTIDAPRDRFSSLAVDGAELMRGSDYTVSGEGMTVTLSTDYLAKLAEGKHQLAASFTDGAASTSFTVAAADPAPKPNPPSLTPTPNPPTSTSLPDSSGKTLAPTGDPLGAALPLVGVLAMSCAVAVALAAVRLRKRR